MISLTRFTRWALRAAARRWPAALREELYREWEAELAYLETRPASAARRLGFALSLLASPPARDAAGVPRGWAEARSGLSPAAALMLAALISLGVPQLTGYLVFSFVPDGFPYADAALLALGCLPLAWWLGRRLPMSRDGRLGPAGPAVLAPLAVLPTLFALATPAPGVLAPSTLLGALAWTPLTALLGLAAVRSGRAAAVVAIVGGPLVAVAATAASTIPVLVEFGREAAAASLMIGDVSLETLGVDTFYFTGSALPSYLVYAWFAVLYGVRAATAPERPVRLPEPVAPAPADRPARSAVARAAGLTAVVAGVLAWAYTVTCLSPVMDDWSAVAPMPGGDGEIYLWVAELRWAAALLAALGTLVATASPRAAVVLGVGLLAVESVLLNLPMTGAAGLRVALLAAAVVIAVSWTAAGRAPHPALIRRRTTTAAIVAAGCGPLLFAQGTPGENHPFMPLGLPITTAGVAIGLTLLGTVTAVATSRHRPHPVLIALLTGLPVAALVVAGIGLRGGPEWEYLGEPGTLLALPLAVVVTALLRRHRPRRRGRTAALWTALTAGALVATVPVLLMAAMMLSFVADLLFQIDGTSYPADGISVLPGALVLLLPLATVLAGKADGAVVEAPAPQPVRGTSG
ncbi:hypothetical protein [Actinoplanes flavus]|uniref:Integral membrane protein n=1 Tax=Actinoplanes flavus TaxID=2820290 RepID=A0ABS3UJQ0_9ACTN|nr:hypothetical protein [Actinoplanes flavus]MBO3737927.1 hypothetical protein [Actinoplanes flavus]